MFYLLLVSLSGQYRLEEKEPKHQKKNDHFQEDENPKGLAPCHFPKAVPIEFPYG